MTLPDGRHYESNFERLVSLPSESDIQADSILLPVPISTGDLVDGDFLAISGSTSLINSSGERVRLKYEIENCGFFISVRGLLFNLVDGFEFHSNRLTDVPLFNAYLLELTPGDGYCYHIYQEALSEAAFSYWSNIREVSERTASIFEPPAGQITGNVKLTQDPTVTVYGYFYATEERVFTLSE